MYLLVTLMMLYSWFAGKKLPVHWHTADGKKWKEGHRVKVTHPKVNSPIISVFCYSLMYKALSVTFYRTAITHNVSDNVFQS